MYPTFFQIQVVIKIFIQQRERKGKGGRLKYPLNDHDLNKIKDSRDLKTIQLLN